MISLLKQLGMISGYSQVDALLPMLLYLAKNKTRANTSATVVKLLFFGNFFMQSIQILKSSQMTI